MKLNTPYPSADNSRKLRYNTPEQRWNTGISPAKPPRDAGLQWSYNAAIERPASDFNLDISLAGRAR